MSKWFPDISDYEGTKKALNGGYYACLVFAAMNVLGIVLMVFMGKMPSSGEAVTQLGGAIAGILVEMAIALVAAWRFKNGKGLVWGSFVLLFFAIEIFVKVTSGTTNVGWIFFYAAILVGLINGLRGAWAVRTKKFDEVETFS